MSEDLKNQFQQLSNKELIDFALEHLGQENEVIRHSALQAHFLRVKNASDTTIARAGDIQLLRSKLNELQRFSNKRGTP